MTVKRSRNVRASSFAGIGMIAVGVTALVCAGLGVPAVGATQRAPHHERSRCDYETYGGGEKNCATTTTGGTSTSTSTTTSVPQSTTSTTVVQTTTTADSTTTTAPEETTTTFTEETTTTGGDEPTTTTTEPVIGSGTPGPDANDNPNAGAGGPVVTVGGIESGSGSLPFTGSPVGMLLGVGLALIASGLGLVARRRNWAR